MLLCIMATKRSGEKLDKNISSIISLEDFKFLERYAKFYYNTEVLRQPTISHLVRHILKNWINNMRKREEVNRKNNTIPQGQMPMRTTYQAPVSGSSIF